MVAAEGSSFELLVVGAPSAGAINWKNVRVTIVGGNIFAGQILAEYNLQ